MSSFDETVHLPFGSQAEGECAVPLATCPARRPLVDPHNFSVITQNCWFSEFYQQERAVALVHMLRERSADFVCLQEVTSMLLNVLLADDWIRTNYVVSDCSVRDIASYGTIIFCRPDPEALRLYRLPSTMGRKLLLAEYALDTHKLIVATVHLESMRQSVKQRAKQLSIIFSLLNAYFRPQAALTVTHKALAPLASTSSGLSSAAELMSPGTRPPRHGHRTKYSWASVVAASDEKESKAGESPRKAAETGTITTPAGSRATAWEGTQTAGGGGVPSPKSGAGRSSPLASTSSAQSPAARSPSSLSAQPMSIVVSSPGGSGTSASAETAARVVSPVSRPVGLILQPSRSTNAAALQSPACVSMNTGEETPQSQSQVTSPRGQPPSPVSALSRSSSATLSRSDSGEGVSRSPSSTSVASDLSVGSPRHGAWPSQFPSHYTHSPSRSPHPGADSLYSPLRSRASDDRSLQSSFSWSGRADSSHSSRNGPTPPGRAPTSPPAGASGLRAGSCLSRSTSGSGFPPDARQAPRTVQRVPTFADIVHANAQAASARAPVQAWSPRAAGSPSGPAAGAPSASAGPSVGLPTPTAMNESEDVDSGRVLSASASVSSVALGTAGDDSTSSSDATSPKREAPRLMIRSPSSFPLSPGYSSRFPSSVSQQSLSSGVAGGDGRQQKVSVVLCGDFNLCHRSAENEQLEVSGFTDVWPFLRPNEAGWTENTDINLMRAEKKKSRKLVRYDRMLLRSDTVNSGGLTPSGSATFASSQAPHATPMSQAAPTPRGPSSLQPTPRYGAVREALVSSSSAASLGPSRPCVPTAIELLGTSPLTPSCFPNAQAARDNIWLSDHFGLFATFALD